jgi:hypothetical protein
MSFSSQFPTHSEMPSMATPTISQMLHSMHSLLHEFSNLAHALIYNNAGPHDIEPLLTILRSHAKVYVPRTHLRILRNFIFTRLSSMEDWARLATWRIHAHGKELSNVWTEDPED